MIPAGLGNRIRLAAGAACLIVAAALFVTKVPETYRAASAAADSNARRYTPPAYRLISTGDTLDIPYEISAAALQYIPPGAIYKIVLPGDPVTAQSSYGIQPFAYANVSDWLRYLLLPAEPVLASQAAPYVICWGCDTTPYDSHTDWLWHNDSGSAIGRVH
jgi:hypothetical protein